MESLAVTGLAQPLLLFLEGLSTETDLCVWSLAIACIESRYARGLECSYMRWPIAEIECCISGGPRHRPSRPLGESVIAQAEVRQRNLAGTDCLHFR